MANIPVELFLGFIGMTFMLIVIGIVRKPNVPVLVVSAGAFILSIAVMTDNIVLGQKQIDDTEISESTDIIMNVNTHQATVDVSGFSTHNRFVGQEIGNQNSLLWNKEIDKVCMFLSKSGTLTGDATVGVWNTVVTPTQSNYQKFFGNITATNIPTTGTLFCSQSNLPVILNQEMAIGIFYNGGAGDSANKINLAVTTSDIFDSTNSYRTRYSTVWSDTTTSDIRMILTVDTINESNTYDDDSNLYPFTQRVKVMFSFFGVVLMLMGALMTRIE